MTKESIAVVEESAIEDEAYSIGLEEFRNVDAEDVDDENPYEGLDYFKETARWANIIAPRLRALCGHGDSGPGTWQVDRQVALILKYHEHDTPAEAFLVDASTLFSDAVDAFDRGARMAIDHAGGGDAVPEEDR